MSEIKVGDLAWIRAKAGLKLSDDEVWFTDLVGTPIKNTDGEFIPDVPGLAALARVVQEVEPDNLRHHLVKAIEQCPVQWNNTRRILEDLASALAPEVK